MKNVTLFLLAWISGLGAAEPLFETACVFPITPDNKPNYRIPSILQAPNGDLLIIVEKRNTGPGDIGDHDIALKRSRDCGRTWEAEQVIFDDGTAVSTDITVGRIGDRLWLFFLRDKKKFAHFTSDDSGASWQGPVMIHDQVIRPEWDKLQGKEVTSTNPKGRMAQWEKGWFQRYGCGPGNTVIQLQKAPRKGRILVPARHREDVGQGRLRSFAHCFYSDDKGASWQLGGTIGMNTSECQFVESNDGSVRVISRNESAEDSPDNMRHLTAISRDGGETWSAPERLEELITPRCHGSVERFDHKTLLFSSPASPIRQKEHPYGRYNLTIRLSRDEGVNWNAGRTLWPHPSAYSDLVVLEDGSIGCVYERADKGSTHYWDELHFARFNLAWLTFGREQTASLRLPAVISDHMVLQAGKPAPIWGWANAGDEIAVGFAGQHKSAKADAAGKWSLKLDPLAASAKARELRINDKVIRDVLVSGMRRDHSPDCMACSSAL